MRLVSSFPRVPTYSQLTYHLQRHEFGDSVMGNAWFVAEWVKCVLIDGFGFEFDQQPSAQRETDLSFRPFGGTRRDAELTWTLGRAVLYASKADEEDEDLVTTPGLRVIAKRRQKKLGDAMLARAARQEESVWDYITMAASFRSRLDLAGNFEQSNRMIVLATAAAETCRSLRREVKRRAAAEQLHAATIAVTADAAADAALAATVLRALAEEELSAAAVNVEIKVAFDHAADNLARPADNMDQAITQAEIDEVMEFVKNAVGRAEVDD
ncbi:hypothetical protein FIBSPDRAFT_146474 [Athelia psychrophila]|uniref:Uncharacterized protein n=1 Tax=Athelia psychrophila TaxID=1759441 RepID=A0A166T5S1_9AGAM|nr:hypothetical protein FIBSPDRAFT_146474 [Fibularhizoctonia sp. CBS 109695]